MGICKFVDELNKLRKSSSESIDNVEKFDDFKKYMHVTRKLEEDLIEILKKVNESGKKTLVLLCGSAGDGKSHLLSYLKNEEKLLDEYEVYNDATESSSPSKTAIETLNEALEGFSDENLMLPGKNIILAINLGVLSNFIESEYGSSYNQLYKYVNRNNILTNQINDNGYNDGSNFQYVSFSDYHMYSLMQDGAKPTYIESIMEKIFVPSEENPFYVNSKRCIQCPISQKCPVKHNYEFLGNEIHRKYVADALVEIMIKEKEILTTREILNFIYDILVAHSFSYKKIAGLTVNSEYLKEYINSITPTLMFDNKDRSELLNQLRKYDPLLNRSEKADEHAIFYYVSMDISKDIRNVIKDESYNIILNQSIYINEINSNKEIKAKIYNMLIRIDEMKKGERIEHVYSSFLKNLYYFNMGKINKLGSLYEIVENAVIQWCGNESDSEICMDDTNPYYSLYEEIKFEEYLEDINKKEIQESYRFLPFITVKFENKKTKEVVQLDIDYSLYDLLYRLNLGYIQTVDDRNNHADFISFIEKILRTGSADQMMIIVCNDGRKASIEKNKFGYRFKVVK